MTSGIEVERKFVVQGSPPEAEAGEAEAVSQGYLALDGETEVRVRRIGDRHLLTVKSGSGLRRVEEELELEPERFAALWALTEGRRVEKSRRRVALDHGLVAEVDVYGGVLEGLVIAEIEFVDVRTARAFMPPAWLGAEVTGDVRYANRSLAVDGLP